MFSNLGLTYDGYMKEGVGDGWSWRHDNGGKYSEISLSRDVKQRESMTGYFYS